MKESYGDFALSDVDSGLDLTSLSGGEPRRAGYTGTKALMQAVLEDGIRSYLQARGRLHEEAEDWISSHQRTSPFAFAVVCETLGLDPSAVRIALRRMRSRSETAHHLTRRTRPTVRRTTRLSA
jgi:hypothetical protein